MIVLATSAALLGGCKSDKTVAQQSLTPTAAPLVIHDGSLMTPGTPKITPLDKPVTQKGQIVPVEWNMFWGENGHNWTVFIDGIKIDSGKLPLQSPQAQQGKLDIELDQPGTHKIKVALCNDHGCTESLPLEINVTAQS